MTLLHFGCLSASPIELVVMRRLRVIFSWVKTIFLSDLFTEGKSRLEVENSALWFLKRN